MVAVVVGALLAVVGALWRWWLPEYRPSLRPGERYGVDVSAHQGRIDWSRVAADDIDFAYVKATEGSDHVDRRYAENAEGAAAAGLEVGAYHFFTLCSPGATQAHNFERTVGALNLRPAVDLELAGNCSARPTAEALASELQAFLEIVGGDGQPPVLYVGSDFADRYPLDLLDGYERWKPRFFRRPSRPWAVWQVGSFAHVEGIEGHVDLDVGG